jgi:hypothetical protein
MVQTNECTLEVIEKEAPKTGTYRGGLLLFLPVVPIIATIMSIATYLGLNLKAPTSLTSIGWLDAVIPLLVGTITTLLLWLFLAYVCLSFTAVHRADKKSYSALLNHFSTLNYSIDAWPDDTNEVRQYRDAICLVLKQHSTYWLVGEGYIKLWRLMDNAEEALITVAPTAKVVSDAVYDEMRLNDSKIENGEEWTNKLRSAVKTLDPDAMHYLKPAGGTKPLAEGAETTQQAPQGAATQSPATRHIGLIVQSVSGPVTSASTQPSATKQGKTAEEEARAILREVKETINDFNTKSW